MKIAAPPVEPQHARANRDERNERDRKPALKNPSLHRSRFVNFYYLLCAAQSLLLKVSYAACRAPVTGFCSFRPSALFDKACCERLRLRPAVLSESSRA